MSQTTRDVPTDALLAVVADRQCRAVLRHLSQNGADPVAIDELIDVLAPLDDASPASPRDERRRTRIKLQHVHLPRLVDVGAIEYDARAATVRYEPVDRIESLLAFVADELE